MKNTRKKMLLSSIAMLLVALIALGSATFAWYADVTTVTARTTTWNATTSSGLVIRHTTSDTWGVEVTDLTTKASMSPRALEFAAYSSAHGASATAEDRSSSHADDLTYIADPRTDAGYLVDSVWVAGEGSAENVNMTVTGTAATASSYLNLAVYIDGNLAKVFTSSTATSTKNLTISGTTATEGAAYTITPFTGTAQQVNTASFQVDSKANGGTEIQVIAYVDGFNEQCKSDSVNTGNISVQYAFTKAS